MRLELSDTFFTTCVNTVFVASKDQPIGVQVPYKFETVANAPLLGASTGLLLALTTLPAVVFCLDLRLLLLDYLSAQS